MKTSGGKPRLKLSLALGLVDNVVRVLHINIFDVLGRGVPGDIFKNPAEIKLVFKTHPLSHLGDIHIFDFKQVDGFLYLNVVFVLGNGHSRGFGKGAGKISVVKPQLFRDFLRTDVVKGGAFNQAGDPVDNAVVDPSGGGAVQFYQAEEDIFQFQA